MGNAKVVNLLSVHCKYMYTIFVLIYLNVVPFSRDPLSVPSLNLFDFRSIFHFEAWRSDTISIFKYRSYEACEQL